MKRAISIILSFAMIIAVVGTIPFTAGAMEMTDATFFAKFDYSSYSGLAAVKTAVDAGEYDTAKTELVNYFIERKNEGTVSAFDITEADENYGMAVLPLDNILTGPYEFDVWLNRFTVTSTSYAQYEIDLTEKVADELSNQAISVMLFERQKQAYPVIAASKEYAGYEPVLVIETAEGDTYEILPDNDTYINSGNTDGTYGDETELYVNEQSNSADSPCDSQTRRAYINFPLTDAANKTVTNATMKLYARLDADCDLDSIDVHVISVGDTMWDEDELAWKGIGGNIYSYQDADDPTWQSPSGADSEYLNVTTRFWYGRAMAYEYLSYLEDPDTYAAEHPLYPDGSVFGEKLISLMDAFATQVESYGYNRTLETGERLNRWVDILDALVDTPAVTENPDKFCNILSYIWGDCSYLWGLDITDGRKWWSNWRIVANAGFFKAVEFLPEFLTYSTWRDKVEENVEYTMDLLYNDDMSFTEAGPSYAIWCAQLFGDCARIAEQNGHPMTQSFKEKLRYAARYAAEVIYPDGYDSNIGDSNYRDQMAVFEELAAFYGNDSILNAYVSGSDDDAEYYSSIYEDVNTAFFRNSWNPDETVYVQFNNNPNTGHDHPDSNQVIMYAYGKPLLVDSGRYSYSSYNTIYNELRYANAHNTIEAVGVSMGDHSDAANELEYSVTNSTLGFATTTQNGYSNVSHTRNVLYFADGYSVVTDFVDGEDSSQEYRQNWHFMPSSNAEMDGNTATTNFYNEANIIIANAGSDEAEILDGYHSADYGLVAASKYASYSKTGEDVKLDTVLYPVKAGESAEVTVTDLAEDDNSKASLAITIDGDTGYYYVKNTDDSDGMIPGVSVSYSGYSFSADLTTDAKMAYYAPGTTTVALVDGTTVATSNALVGNLLESPTNIASLTMTLDGTTLNIEGESLVASTDTSEAIKIRNMGAESVTLNGEAIDFTKQGGYIYAVKSTSVAGMGDVSVSGKEYTIVDGTNLISNGDFSDGLTDWPNAYDGGDLSGWTASDNETYTGGSGYAATNSGADGKNNGGSSVYTMRRFIEVESGKQYYLTYNAYNTGSATTANGMMSAAVLTSGGPVYGSFSGISFYNYNTYGGMNSWSAESNTQVGGSISRSDDLYSAGMNEKAFLFTVPEGAEHLMLSFGAWTTPGQIYWSNFNLVEVEEIKDETDYAVVNISFVDSEGNEIAETVTEDADEGTVYIYDAPESIDYDGGYYVLDEASSVLSVKVKRGENSIVAVYDKMSGVVTVNYVDTEGNTLLESQKLTFENGVELTDENIPYDEMIKVDDTYYALKKITNLGVVIDGNDVTVDVIYDEAIVEETVYYATRGDSLNSANNNTTGFASETDTATYNSRLMTDNRSWVKRAGVMGFEVDKDVDSIVSAIVTVHVNDSGNTSGNKPSVTGSAIYSGEELNDGWSRGNVSGFALPDVAISSGSVSGEYVTFDVTEFVQNGGGYDFALFTTTSGEYIVFDSELTDYVPTITIVTAEAKKDLGITLYTGAQVRVGSGVTEENKVGDGSGIRFIAEISNENTIVSELLDEKDAEGNALFGVAVWIDKYDAETEPTLIPANIFQSDSVFTAAITDINAGNYNRVFVARPYAIVDGEYVYGDAVERTPYQVAAGNLLSGSEMTDALVSVLNAYANETGARINLSFSTSDNTYAVCEATYASGGDDEETEAKAFFTASCEDIKDDAENVIGAKITLTGASSDVVFYNYWNESIRINNNNSTAVQHIDVNNAEIATDEDSGITTLTFDFYADAADVPKTEE